MVAHAYNLVLRGQGDDGGRGQSHLVLYTETTIFKNKEKKRKKFKSKNLTQ